MMSEEKLERNLAAFDYSVFSSVRDSLLQTLLVKHRHDNGEEHILPLVQKLRFKRIADDDLDTVAAAGVLYGGGQEPQNKLSISYTTKEKLP